MRWYKNLKAELKKRKTAYDRAYEEIKNETGKHYPDNERVVERANELYSAANSTGGASDD